MKQKILGSLLAVILVSAPALRAASYDVFAQGNSSSGGVGLPTLFLNAGQAFQTSASATDLWSAGALPRWSNADGLVADLFATGTDESGLPAGTQIGSAFALWTQHGFTAPYGALVGQIGSNYILLGTSFAGTALTAGLLQLWYWDSNNGDNSEKITVTVSTGVPDGGGSVLLLLAGLALCGMRRWFGR